MLAQLKPWSDEANIIGQESIGKTAVYLDSKTCYNQECNLGNLFTDAMIYEVNICGGTEKFARLKYATGELNSTLSWKMTKDGLALQLP